MDRVRQKERQQDKKKSEYGKDSSLLCRPDVRLCAGLPVQASGTGLVWWSLLTAQEEQLCTGPQLYCSHLRCGTNTHPSLFTFVVDACLLAFVYTCCFWWCPMTDIALLGRHFQIVVSGSWWSSWGVRGARNNKHFEGTITFPASCRTTMHLMSARPLADNLPEAEANFPMKKGCCSKKFKEGND